MSVAILVDAAFFIKRFPAIYPTLDNGNPEVVGKTLNIEDVPTAASEILDRHLSTNEIAQIEDAVAERIDWFEAIAGAISEKIEEA